MISAIDQRDSLVESLRHGAADYVVKPFEDDRMVAAIKNIFAKKQEDTVGSRQ